MTSCLQFYEKHDIIILHLREACFYTFRTSPCLISFGRMRDLCSRTDFAHRTMFTCLPSFWQRFTRQLYFSSGEIASKKPRPLFSRARHRLGRNAHAWRNVWFSEVTSLPRIILAVRITHHRYREFDDASRQ